MESKTHEYPRRDEAQKEKGEKRRTTIHLPTASTLKEDIAVLIGYLGTAEKQRLKTAVVVRQSLVILIRLHRRSAVSRTGSPPCVTKCLNTQFR